MRGTWQASVTQDQQEPYLALSQPMHRSALATEADSLPCPTPPPHPSSWHGHTAWAPRCGRETPQTRTQPFPLCWQRAKGYLAGEKLLEVTPCSTYAVLAPTPQSLLCPSPGRALALAVLSVPWVLAQLLCCCHGCARGASLPMTRPLQEGEQREREGLPPTQMLPSMVSASIPDPKSPLPLHPGHRAHLPLAWQSWPRSFCAQVQWDGSECRGSEAHPYSVAVSSSSPQEDSGCQTWQ